MDPKQNIKAQLALLAFFLQTPIPDELLLLYSRDLEDLGPEGLTTAIEALKRDDTLWTGRFPLPAKIRSYLTGTIEDQAIISARKLLDVSSYNDARAKLSTIEYCVASEYGLQAIFERNPTNTSTIYAQLRDQFRAVYTKDRADRLRLEMELKRGLPGNLEAVRKEIARTEEVLGSSGEGTHLLPGQGGDQ